MRILPPDFVQNIRSLPIPHAVIDDIVEALTCGESRKGVRTNLRKITPEGLCARLAQDSEYSKYCAHAFVLPVGAKTGDLSAYKTGLLYSQEPSASIVAESVDLYPTMTVLDACAAPGGKTTHIADYVTQGIIVANEYVYKRCGGLMDSLVRLGVANAIVTCCDTSAFPATTKGVFDVVFADCPCSGEGMFRREANAIPEWSLANVAECAARQSMILDNLADTVANGGALVYSTCTLNTVEDEGVVTAFLKAHSDFVLVEPTPRVRAVTMSGITLDDSYPMENACRVFPSIKGYGEGHFVAVLRRMGDVCTPKTARRAFTAPRVDSRTESECNSLLSALTSHSFAGDMYRVGDKIMLCPTPRFDCTQLGVLRAGIHAFTQKGNKYVINPRLATYLLPDECLNTVDLASGTAKAQVFLEGGEIESTVLTKSSIVVCLDGYPLVLSKCVEGRLKNYL